MCKQKLLDALADLEHRQWSGWAKAMLDDPSVQMSDERRERWQKLVTTPYEELSQDLKDQDREHAKSALRIVMDFLEQSVL